jgi:glycosyltransferase involved in cell wall biosynthesis
MPKPIPANSIRCVIDPAHQSWVLGGLMRELALCNDNIHNDVVALPSVRSFFKYLSVRLTLTCEKSLLFSSLTPLENYLRFPLISTNQELKLWFTHKEGKFSKRQVKCLKRASQIYVHSSREAVRLRSLGCKSVTVALGAIDESRFSERSITGNEVVWVGTPIYRKAPWVFLAHVRSSPQINFRLMGNGWENSIYWDEVKSFKNLKYIPITKPLTSRDFDGCFAYLMTSKIEGGPMPLLETLSAGLAPIATDCGFVRDIFNFCGIPTQFIYQSSNSIEEQVQFLRLNWPKYEARVRLKALELNFSRFSKILSETGF